MFDPQLPRPLAAVESPYLGDPRAWSNRRGGPIEHALSRCAQSLEAFYSAHESQHPCIRVYGAVRREIETAGPFEEGPGGTIAQRIERHCREAQHG